MLLSGNRAGLEKIFKMQLTPKAGGAAGATGEWKLVLTPRVAPMDKLIKELELRGRGLNLNELDVREASGDWTRTSFSRRRPQSPLQRRRTGEVLQAPRQMTAQAPSGHRV